MVILKNLLNDNDSKNVIMNICISFIIKGGSLVVALFTTSAYISYFSNDSILGIWFTLLSILSWMLNFDFGIGNGLRNKLVESLAANNIKQSREYISSAYIFLALLSATFLVLFGLIFYFLPWNDLLGIPCSLLDSKTLIITVFIVLLSIILQLFLRLIVSISYAMQHSFVANCLSLCTNTILLSFVLFANYTNTNGSIITLAIVYFFAVNIPLLIASIILFSKELKEYIPNMKFFNFKYAKDIVKLGSAFLYLQVVAMIIGSTANFLISNLLGPDQVVPYQLYYKIFNLVGAIIGVAIGPMWSAITKALEEERYEWLRKSILLMLDIVVLAAIAQFAIVPFLPLIFKVWLRENAITVDYSIALVFAVFGGVFVWDLICSHISNGLGKIKIQSIWLTIGAGLTIVVSAILSKIWKSYIAITIGMIVGYLPYCIIQTIWLLKYCNELKSKSESRLNIPVRRSHPSGES